MPFKEIRKMSQQDKAAIVSLAEAHRRDGVINFVERTAKELDLPMSIVKNNLQKYRKGELAVTFEEVTRFSNDEWADAKEEVVFKAHQLSNQLIDDILEARKDGDAKTIHLLAQSVGQLERLARDLRDGKDGGGGGRTQQTNVQIVIPPKERGEDPQEIKIDSTEETT